MSVEEMLDWRLTDPRHDAELWQFEYEVDRYLRTLPNDKLNERYEGLCQNLFYLVNELRDPVPLRAGFLSSWWWLRKRTHVIAEYRARGVEVPNTLCNPELRGPIWPVGARPRGPNSCEHVVRYGKADWLRTMMLDGVVRLAPATSFRGESMNAARQDDELNKSRFTPGDAVKVTMLDGAPIPLLGDMTTTSSYQCDYYMVCTSTEFDLRLFNPFEADACITIWDVDTFAARLQAAAEQALPGWYFHYNPISYFDPWNLMPREAINPGMSKDFSYAFQREFRFLCFPLSGQGTRGHLELRLGSIEDIAGMFGSDGRFLGIGKSGP